MRSIVLAAEGGYQAFTLNGGEWGWLIFSAATAVLALIVGGVLVRGVLAADQGTPKMIAIAGAIQEGAMAYLRRQFRTIALIMIPVAALVFFALGLIFWVGWTIATIRVEPEPVEPVAPATPSEKTQN